MHMDFDVRVHHLEFILRLSQHTAKIGCRLRIQGFEGRSKIGKSYGAVGTEQVTINDIITYGRTIQHIAKHNASQIERVIGYSLGDVARLVLHHLFIVDPHLRFDGLRFHSLVKLVVG